MIRAIASRWTASLDEKRWKYNESLIQNFVFKSLLLFSEPKRKRTCSQRELNVSRESHGPAALVGYNLFFPFWCWKSGGSFEEKNTRHLKNTRILQLFEWSWYQKVGNNKDHEEHFCCSGFQSPQNHPRISLRRRNTWNHQIYKDMNLKL